MLVVIVFLAVILIFAGGESDSQSNSSNYVTPDDSFLLTEVIVRPGISDLGIDAQQLANLMARVPIASGGFQKVNGWTKTTTGYRLHMDGHQSYYIDLEKSGSFLIMKPIKIAGQEVSALAFMTAMSNAINN